MSDKTKIQQFKEALLEVLEAIEAKEPEPKQAPPILMASDLHGDMHCDAAPVFSKNYYSAADFRLFRLKENKPRISVQEAADLPREDWESIPDVCKFAFQVNRGMNSTLGDRKCGTFVMELALSSHPPEILEGAYKLEGNEEYGNVVKRFLTLTPLNEQVALSAENYSGVMTVIEGYVGKYTEWESVNPPVEVPTDGSQ